MSALPLASPRPLRSPDSRPRPYLEVAPTRAQRRARPRLVPAIVTIAGIGVILLGQLLMSIAVADGAYRISDLQSQQRDLERQQQALTENLEVLSSTQNLTANAENLGMVASGNPVFLDLSTGAVTGNPTAAGGSLTGSAGNQIGNSLLTGTSLVSATTTPSATPSTASPNGAPTASGATPPTSGSPSSGSQSSGSPSSGPIPSPTTH
ncbi:MAG: hypothetical protein ABIR17_06650 [Pseudolysinimonas sp.]|uniref:hypothetical protein n=1 Tax=Pseudolysinimonas sp. TaxID=2680009 RepID=UPI00326469CA